MPIHVIENLFKRRFLVAMLLTLLAFKSHGQCQHQYNVYKVYPVNEICALQYVTLRADYIPPDQTNGTVYVEGEFRWYSDRVSMITPVHTKQVGSDYGWSSEYTFMPLDGATNIYVRFYDAINQCESSHVSYGFNTGVPDIWQEYARECGDGVGRIQMRSHSSNAYFQLNRLTENGYQWMGSNATGYFQLYDFSGENADKYYVSASASSGCPGISSKQVQFDIQYPTPPTVTGTTSYCQGLGTTLTASGAGSTFRWYNASGAVVSNSSQFAVPTSLQAGTYHYSVERISGQGCITDRAYPVVTVKPRPADGLISASATEIFEGQPVTISGIAGVGEPHYWCTSNGGASWNVFENGYAGQSSFSFTPPSVGTYSFYLYNHTECGFCWDPGNGGCRDRHVDVNVIKDYNYINEFSALTEGLSESQITTDPADRRSLSTTYYDGLGRPMQVVNWQETPAFKDRVLPFQYDDLGREEFSYLPYVSDGNDGWYNANALKDPATTATTPLEKYRSGKQYKFYQNGDNTANDQFPYSKRTFEVSTLNRVIKQGAPGLDGQPDAENSYTSTDHTVKMSPEGNGADEVLFLTYADPTDDNPSGLVSAGGNTIPAYYDANRLYKNKTKDENNHEVITYVDVEDRVVCKKVQYDTVNGVMLYASTYYVYDDVGNLVIVLPPEATGKLLELYNLH